jgi:DNA-binding Lrp family transcriptional regulator
MVHRKEHTPEDLAKAQHLYETTPTPVGDIAAMLGISRSTFSKRVRAGNWQRRRAGEGFPVAPDVAASAPTPVEARAALALRIQCVAEREMDAVERVLDVLGPSNHAEADRCARALAGIARTLREITALNTPEDVTRADDTDNDTVPVDLDALRCELARRIKGLIEAERAAGDGGRDAPAVGSAEQAS